jgi:hypothetical protein
MSNHLAVAAVTMALKAQLSHALAADNLVNDVTVIHPGTPPTKDGVNIYLYQVTPNIAFRNADAPTRSATGAIQTRPRVALDLHYLLSFFAIDEKDAHKYLGSVARRLHAEPVLSRALVQSASIDDLADSDLHDQIELVKFVPTALSLEEMSKLWSVMLQTRYRLSMAYKASVVLIETDDPIETALPVRQTNMMTLPFREPRITRVLSHPPGITEPTVRPIHARDFLVVDGHDLAAEVTMLRFDQEEVVVETTSTDSRVAGQIPPTLRAGTHTVQVIQQLNVAETNEVAAYRIGGESAAVPFVLQPRAVLAVTGSRVTATAIEPKVGPSQRAVLILNRRGDPRSYCIPSRPRPVMEPPTDTDHLEFELEGVPGGNLAYLVRLRIDGAETVLIYDDVQRAYTGPTVVI